MLVSRSHGWALVAGLFLVMPAATARAAGLPEWLPRYDLTADIDVANHQVRGVLRATWTNHTQRPVPDLVFNAHSRYVVPAKDVGLVAKTLEILRMNPSESMGIKDPPLVVNRVTLDGKGKTPGPELTFTYAGDTLTDLVVPLPTPLPPGVSVTVNIDFTLNLPQKQGRWGQWLGVTYLSNWLPVFAVYEECPPPDRDGTAKLPGWRPTPFVPWHQPFYNEAGHYRACLTLPADERLACSGSVVGCTELPGKKKQVEIRATGVRDFSLTCSRRYQVYEGRTPETPGVPQVRVRVFAFPEHDHYAKEMVRIASEAIVAYSRWFGPYPYPEFTIAESYFGWNGNECGTLVLIDERVFGMPKLAGSYIEYLVSHEVCHQWWYNVVGTNGYCETWMDEALATHFSNRLMTEKVGKNNRLMKYPKALDWLPNIHREDYRSYGMYGTIGRGENGPVVGDMPKFGHVVNLFSMCYDKGARIVNLVEDRLGPVAFLDFMRCVYAKYQFRILRVADFQKELEAYTGRSWEEFFRDWVHGCGLTDWKVESVEMTPPCLCKVSRLCCNSVGIGHKVEHKKLTVVIKQCGEITEQTVLGIQPYGCEGYPIRIPIQPGASAYRIDDPPARVEPLDDGRIRVELELDDEPAQVAIDPDQVLVDRIPVNNFWRTPVRWRVTPLYTFLEETDLTNAYDRWNVIFGPWIYGASYNDAWYTRSTMVGLRAGAYRTQHFSGGVYGAYRTDFRDVVFGADGVWDHWPDSHWQVGMNFEKRLAFVYEGDDHALRGAMYARRVFQYGSSLYLPPIHFLEGFASYQDNFLPIPNQSAPGAQRYDSMTFGGLHYRINYLTPYWDPEGGFQFDAVYTGGVANLERIQGLNRGWASFSTVKYLPDLSTHLANYPRVQEWTRPVLEYLADTRVAVRAYGATAAPTQGEFFPLGSSELFRAFDMAERQGSTVWVGSVEWRLPICRRMSLDAADHIVGLRNVYAALFYDVGDAYVSGKSVGNVAHGVGAGLRLDVAWFGFVERTMLRFDLAKAVNADTGVQVWFGLQHPF